MTSSIRLAPHAHAIKQARGIRASVDVVVLARVGLAARHLRGALLTERVVVVIDDRDALTEDPAFAERIRGAHVDQDGKRRLSRRRQLHVGGEVDRLALGLDVDGDLRAGDGAGDCVRRRLRAEDVLLGLLADLLPPAVPGGLRRHARPIQLQERVGQLGDLREDAPRPAALPTTQSALSFSTTGLARRPRRRRHRPRLSRRPFPPAPAAAAAVPPAAAGAAHASGRRASATAVGPRRPARRSSAADPVPVFAPPVPAVAPPVPVVAPPDPEPPLVPALAAPEPEPPPVPARRAA